MKILHVFHASDLANGVDRTTLTLIAKLHELGVLTYALVPRVGQVTEALNILGIDYDTLPLECCTGIGWRAELRYLRNSSGQWLFTEDLIRQKNIDLVHINTGHPMGVAFAASSAGIPAVWHIHSPFEIDYERYMHILSKNAYASLLNELGSFVIAVSEDIRTSLSPFFPLDKLKTVYNGVDLVDLKARAENTDSIRVELDLPENALLVLGVGRISAQKDFAAFVRIASQVVKRNTDAYFAIAGPEEDVTLADALNRQIVEEKLQKKVLVLGPRTDVPRLMSQADLFLSTAIYEGHPITTLEAMALGKPVVAMDCSGLRECLNNNIDGLLIPSGDEHAAAQAVIELLTNKARRFDLGNAARNTVNQQFSSLAFARKFLEVATEAVKLGPARITIMTLELTRGLLDEIAKASYSIDELDRPGKLALLMEHGLQSLRRK